MEGLNDLKQLEERSIYIIREAVAEFKNPAVMWSTGKDSSVCLWLCKKAFFGKVPFPVIHIDTGCKFPQIYEYRDRMAKEWNLDLIVAKNEDALKNGMGPDKGRDVCCTALKTETLKNLIDERGFDAILVSIRRDEHGIRAKERYFSPRDKEFKWQHKNQPAETWDLFEHTFKEASHVRVHPILHWAEIDCWRYVKQEGMPWNQLYSAKFVEQQFGWKHKRFRSLGCMPCTVPVDSDASTIDEIVEELKTTKVSERSGRAQDKEREYAMQKLRSLGYM